MINFSGAFSINLRRREVHLASGVWILFIGVLLASAGLHSWSGVNKGGYL